METRAGGESIATLQLSLGLVVIFALWLLCLGVLPGEDESDKYSAMNSAYAATPVVQTPVQERRGQVVAGPNATSTYFIQRKEGDSHEAIFQPALPPDNGILTTTLLQVLKDTYLQHNVWDLTPQHVSENGVDYLMFEGTRGNYYMLVGKEDTGEVSSVTYFKK
jgi:hypothetical protein